MIFQTYSIECDGHSFEFALDRETMALIRARGYQGDMRGVTCPTCGVVRSLSIPELIRLRNKAEADVTAEAEAEALAELEAAHGSGKDARTKIKHEDLRALKRTKIREHVAAAGPLECKKNHAKKKDTKATWTDHARPFQARGGEPPVAPDTTGVIDSTG